jgi:hypothetical protein
VLLLEAEAEAEQGREDLQAQRPHPWQARVYLSTCHARQRRQEPVPPSPPPRSAPVLQQAEIRESLSCSAFNCICIGALTFENTSSVYSPLGGAPLAGGRRPVRVGQGQVGGGSLSSLLDRVDRVEAQVMLQMVSVQASTPSGCDKGKVGGVGSCLFSGGNSLFRSYGPQGLSPLFSSFRWSSLLPVLS